MQPTNTQPEQIAIPDDFDEILGRYYDKAIHPEDINEVACNMAGVMQDYGISVAQMERVLHRHNVAFLMPETARQFATEAVRLTGQVG